MEHRTQNPDIHRPKDSHRRPSDVHGATGDLADSVGRQNGFGRIEHIGGQRFLDFLCSHAVQVDASGVRICVLHPEKVARTQATISAMVIWLAGFGGFTVAR